MEVNIMTIDVFADFVEAKCPRYGASVGESREDVGVSIEMHLVEGDPR
jgi:hypothetical protein